MATNPAVTVYLNGQAPVVITSVKVNGTTTTLYSDSSATAAVVLPSAVGSDTTYYFKPSVRGYAEFGFREIDGSTLPSEGGVVMLNNTLKLSPGPTSAQVIADASRADIEELFLDGLPAMMRKNLSRTQLVSDITALADGVMTSVALFLEAGDTVTTLTWLTSSTQIGTPAHCWTALYSSASTPALLSQSADYTGAWAADTSKGFTLAAAQTITTSGIYYASLMVNATTPCTLAGITLDNAAGAGAIVAGMKVLAKTSGSGLTTTAPATIDTPTTVATVPLVIAT